MKIQEGDQTKFPTIILELCGKRFAFRVKEDQMKIIEMNPTDTVTTVFAKKKKKRFKLQQTTKSINILLLIKYVHTSQN